MKRTRKGGANRAHIKGKGLVRRSRRLREKQQKKIQNLQQTNKSKRDVNPEEEVEAIHKSSKKHSQTNPEEIAALNAALKAAADQFSGENAKETERIKEFLQKQKEEKEQLGLPTTTINKLERPHRIGELPHVANNTKKLRVINPNDITKQSLKEVIEQHQKSRKKRNEEILRENTQFDRDAQFERIMEIIRSPSTQKTPFSSTRKSHHKPKQGKVGHHGNIDFDANDDSNDD